MLEQVNFLTVITASVSAFVLGGLWYSPVLFGTIWLKESGVDPQQGGHPLRVYGVSLLASLVSALAYALILGKSQNVLEAIHYGLLLGVGVAAMSFTINYQFANRSFKLLWVDGGYHSVQFLLYALIFAYWP